MTFKEIRWWLIKNGWSPSGLKIVQERSLDRNISNSVREHTSFLDARASWVMRVSYIINGFDTNRKCPICDNIIEENYNENRYLKLTCSRSCAVKLQSNNEVIIKRREQTCLRKYGVTNPFKNKYIQDKIRKKQLELYKCKYSLSDISEGSELLGKYEHLTTATLLKFKCGCGNIFDRRISEAIKPSSAIGNVCLDCMYKRRIVTGYRVSKIENEISEFISKYTNVDNTNRSVLNGTEIDIFIPEKNIGIEYNGLYWHSEAPFYTYKNYNKDVRYIKNRHQTKSCMARDNGIRIIHVWEDDWSQHKKRTKMWLLSICGLADQKKIYARKTSVVELTFDESKNILNANHIQGAVASSKYYGLKYKNDIVSIMTFKKDNENWILNRYCVEFGHTIIGGFNKLLSHHVKNHSGNIISFADLSWVGDLNVYTRNGFIEVNRIPIDYKYLYEGVRSHKFGFRHSELKKKLKNYDPTKTEYQNCIDHGIYRIWDCGKIKYLLTVSQQYGKL